MRTSARIVLLVLVAVALVAPGTASGHALLIGTDPADSSHLDSAPRQVRLTFSEDVSPEFRSVHLIAPDGRPVVGTRLGGQGSVLTLDLPRLKPGTYAIDWRVVAEDDGHTTSGTIALGVGVAAAARGAATREVTPSAVDVGLRWLRFAGLALLLGGVALTYVVLDAAQRVPAVPIARRRALTAAALGAGLATLASLASLAREAWTLSSSAGLSFPSVAVVRDLLSSSRWGQLWLLEEAAFLTMLTLVLRARRPGSGSAAYAPLAVVWLAVIGICEALASHAAALSDAAVLADGAHVLAAALWLGVVGALAVAIWPSGMIGRDGAKTLAVACRWRFGLLAGTGAAVAALTGLYSAGREVTSIDALLTTFYGRVLLAKTAAVALASTLGAVNALLLTGVARGRRRSIAISLIAAETLVGAAVFLSAGVLTASSPARGPQFDAPRPIRAPTLAANARDVLVTATVRPNRPGENVLAVQAVSSRRPPPASIQSVEARIGGARKPIGLRPIEPGRYIATVNLPRSGPAGMSVVVRRPGQALTTRMAWSVDARDPARPVTVSARPLSSIVDPLALALCAALVLGGSFALFARRGRMILRGLPQYTEEPS